MIIKYYKTLNDIPFYEYTLEEPSKHSKKSLEMVFSNPELSSESHTEIDEVEYNELINKMLQGHVI